ncbi:MAG: YdbL family protein [Deltaproteobacteria bacterium]|nr:YdbL family protein [Deltaproteobacteria bacterium]
MKVNKMRLIFPLWLLSIVMSCVTVNVYFPAKEVEKKAGDIIDDIRKMETPPPTSPSGPQSSINHLKNLIFNRNLAYAQRGGDGSSPAIQNLKQQIRERFPRLAPFFQKGVVGEGRTGLVEILNNKDLAPAEKREVKSLVEAENRDRLALYQEVAKSMNITSDQIGKVQRIFARKWQQSAERGWWIQKDDKQWVQK